MTMKINLMRIAALSRIAEDLLQKLKDFQENDPVRLIKKTMHGRADSPIEGVFLPSSSKTGWIPKVKTKDGTFIEIRDSDVIEHLEGSQEKSTGEGSKSVKIVPVSFQDVEKDWDFPVITTSDKFYSAPFKVPGWKGVIIDYHPSSGFDGPEIYVSGPHGERYYKSPAVSAGKNFDINQAKKDLADIASLPKFNETDLFKRGFSSG